MDAVQIPLDNVEALWQELEGFETDTVPRPHPFRPRSYEDLHTTFKLIQRAPPRPARAPHRRWTERFRRRPCERQHRQHPVHEHVLQLVWNTVDARMIPSKLPIFFSSCDRRVQLGGK